MQNAHDELIMHPRMIDLVNKKWERFARRIFFYRFMTTFAYMTIFLLTTVLDQTRNETVIIIIYRLIYSNRLRLVFTLIYIHLIFDIVRKFLFLFQTFLFI